MYTVRIAQRSKRIFIPSLSSSFSSIWIGRRSLKSSSLSSSRGKTTKATIVLPSVRGFTEHRRYISSFLSLSSDNLKHSHRERRLIKFPNYHVYNVVANVNDYKYFVPWCVDSRILKRTSPTFMEAQLAVGFQLFSERYTSEVLLEPQTKIIVHAKQTQLFHYLTNEWSFQPGPHPEHDTWLSFKVDFQFRSLLYAQASHLFFDEVVSKMVAAFERRCEVTWDPKLYPQLTMKNNANGSVAVPITNKGKTNKETIIHVVPVSSSSPQSTASIPPSLHLPPSFSSSTSIPKINTIITSKIVPVLTNVPQASSTIVSRKEEHNEHSPSHHKLPPPLRGSVWL